MATEPNNLYHPERGMQPRDPGRFGRVSPGQSLADPASPHWALRSAMRDVPVRAASRRAAVLHLVQERRSPDDALTEAARPVPRDCAKSARIDGSGGDDA